MHSIRTLITSIIIVVILTSILSVFAASYIIIQSETDKDSVRMMNLISRDTQKSLEKYFESIEQAVEIAANIAIEDLDSVFLVESGAVRSGMEETTRTPEQTAALDVYLRDYFKTIKVFFSGVADYAYGVTAYYYCIDPEISRNEHGFYYKKVGKTGFIEQPPIDIDELSSSEPGKTAWYNTAASLGYPAWIGPYASEFDQGMWIFSYCVPIYRSGALIGVMGMDIPCETLIDQIKDIRVYETGYVCLLDQHGYVVYHPDLPIGGDPDVFGLSVGKEIFRKESSGDELIRYTVNGDKRQMSFSTLSNGLKLASIAPSSEINAPWIRLIRVIALIAAAVIIIFVVMSLFVMGIITSPLKQLTDASRRLADADYDVDLTYHAKNEIGTLTGSFNRMRDQIRQYIGDLNYQLYHDRLTDLPNMRHFFTLAENVKKQLISEGRQPVMLYFDLIGLRHYNRQYGFKRGDSLITGFAGILSRQFGGQRVCRFSGDHFAAVTDEAHVEEELQAVLRECGTAMDGDRLPVRIGVYPYRLGDVDVNVACDRAKFAGDLNRGELSSTVTWYDEKMLKKSELYVYFINNLDKALEEGWVQVYYMPIIRAADGKVCDEEALARWIDPVLGFISPGDFVPALEEFKLIYKLDLYVVDQVLTKMKQLSDAGFHLIPRSINLSRMDFESCDIVEEIRRRVDDAGIDRSLISIEITESVIGSDFDFMKEQVIRFRQLGFPVWMDDFGSGYSSLDVLQQIHFDLIKFDMRFMDLFGEREESRIILTQLMNMAIGLGIETVCEGVEQAEQVEFLREIGCTRLQGYHFGKPAPFPGMAVLLEKGTTQEFENPKESGYYATLSRISLYDISALSDGNDESLSQYFDTLPMSIIEVSGTKLRYNRCNRSYRDFLERTLGIRYYTDEIDTSELSSRLGASFLKAVVQCSRDGNRVIIDEKIDRNAEAHILLRRVAVNPVTGTAAVTAAVLAVIRNDENPGTNFSQIAKALSADYVDLYYVDLDTEKFIQYSPDPEHEDLVMERHGEDFFASARREAMKYIYVDDRENFVKIFTKENVVNMLDTEQKFKLTYRLMRNGDPCYVEMKAVRMTDDPSHIILGVNNVDAQMREKEALARIMTERTVYTRVSALTQGFLCIYTVDPVTGHYDEYRASGEYSGLGVPSEGEDFFAEAQIESLRHVYSEDQTKFRTLLTPENVMTGIEKSGSFAFQYRMMISGEPVYVSLKAALIEEQNKPVLLIGINNIDAQMKHEQDYERKLFSARSRANLDTLTGVKNRTAYDHMSEYLTRQIEEGQNVRYAIVLCRICDIASVNETLGRSAGDQLIRDVCEIICDTFKHSPVFRVAGDEFAVVAQGHDLEYVDDLVGQLRETSSGRGLAVASGMAKYNGTESIASMFASAERLCKSQ